MNENKEEIEMVVAGLVVDPVSNAPIVVLKEPEGEICLPIWIGMSEASSIATALKNIEVARPMTHDLLKNTLDILGGKIQRVGIISLHDNTFFAIIEVMVGEECRELDARPSDAIALAVRSNVPIFVTREVLDKAQATLVPLDAEGNPVPDGVSEEMVDATEAFTQTEEYPVQHFADLDKEQLSELLKNMDPDDFKYKM
jgi:bifunctional DNase/RNase